VPTRSEISATLCATLSISAMGFMPSILVIRAHSYQLAHDEITRQYGSEGVNRGLGMFGREIGSLEKSRNWTDCMFVRTLSCYY